MSVCVRLPARSYSDALSDSLWLTQSPSRALSYTHSVLSVLSLLYQQKIIRGSALFFLLHVGKECVRPGGGGLVSSTAGSCVRVSVCVPVCHMFLCLLWVRWRLLTSWVEPNAMAFESVLMTTMSWFLGCGYCFFFLFFFFILGFRKNPNGAQHAWCPCIAAVYQFLYGHVRALRSEIVWQATCTFFTFLSYDTLLAYLPCLGTRNRQIVLLFKKGFIEVIKLNCYYYFDMLPLSTVFVLIEVRVRYYMGFNVYLVIKEYLLVEYMTFAALHSRNPYFPTAAFPVHIFMCVCVCLCIFFAGRSFHSWPNINPQRECIHVDGVNKLLFDLFSLSP